MADPGRPLTKMESIRNLINGNVSDLSGLTTVGKTSLVEAVNEIVSGMGAVINDATTSIWSTWSSSKITTELNTKAPKANPVFTGTVTVPDNSLSIPKTSGLQTALNTKMTLDPSNVISGVNAFISGGIDNKALGEGSIVLGGVGNEAQGKNTTAGGYGSVSTRPSTRAHGSKFATPGDAQDMVQNIKAISTTATNVILVDEVGYQPLIPENSTWAVTGTVVGRKTNTTPNESIFWEFKVLMKRDVGNTTTAVVPVVITEVGKSAGTPWTITVVVSTAGYLTIRCYGEAGKTIRWLANLKTVQISN